MHIDAAAIAQMLPHRDPILLVESVAIDAPGQAGRGTVRLPAQALLLGGRSGSELLQELALEAAAQTLGVVLGSDTPQGTAAGRDEKHLLLGFNDVEFGTAEADPGAPFDVRVERSESAGTTYVAQFEVTQHAVRIAAGAVMVMKG